MNLEVEKDMDYGYNLVIGDKKHNIVLAILYGEYYSVVKLEEDDILSQLIDDSVIRVDRYYEKFQELMFTDKTVHTSSIKIIHTKSDDELKTVKVVFEALSEEGEIVDSREIILKEEDLPF